MKYTQNMPKIEEENCPKCQLYVSARPSDFFSDGFGLLINWFLTKKDCIWYPSGIKIFHKFQHIFFQESNPSLPSYPSALPSHCTITTGLCFYSRRSVAGLTYFFIRNLGFLKFSPFRGLDAS